MRFWAHGPFEVPVEAGARRDSFWKQVREDEEYDSLEKNSLCNAVGCYVFLTRWGQTHTPYYVGKACGQAGFYQEVFTPHKTRYYREIAASKPRHKPMMMLFPLITGTGRLARPGKANNDVIEWMERTLIGMALSKNPQLYNKRDTKRLREYIVDGVFGAKAHTHRYPASATARRMLTDHDD